MNQAIVLDDDQVCDASLSPSDFTVPACSAKNS